MAPNPKPRRAPTTRSRPSVPSRPSRPSASGRPGRPSIRRRKPEPKGAEKFLAMLGSGAGKARGAAPAGAKGKSGLALLGAGAVAALSQREKLTGLLRKGRGDSEAETTTQTPPAPPVV